MQAFISYRGVVYAWHCDHFGHMNNVWYLCKFDEASWHFVAQIGFTPSYLRNNSRGLVTVEQTAAFKRELRAGDVVEVCSEILEVREKVIRLQHTMYNAETGEVAATLVITAVHFDLHARKSCPLPEDKRRAAENLIRRDPVDAQVVAAE